MIPTFLYDIIRVLLLLAGPAAFMCLFNAGISLRKEGERSFGSAAAFPGGWCGR